MPIHPIKLLVVETPLLKAKASNAALLARVIIPKVRVAGAREWQRLM